MLRENSPQLKNLLTDLEAFLDALFYFSILKKILEFSHHSNQNE